MTVQWLEMGAFTWMFQVQYLIGELRSLANGLGWVNRWRGWGRGRDEPSERHNLHTRSFIQQILSSSWWEYSSKEN